MTSDDLEASIRLTSLGGGEYFGQALDLPDDGRTYTASGDHLERYEQ